MILSTIQRNIDDTVGYMSDFWTITAASEQAGYPASNLLTSDLNQKWVSWGQRASHNWIEAVSDIKNTERAIALVGLLGIDRTNPNHALTGTFSNNTYRIIVDSVYPIATRRRPPVESIAASTNLTGLPEVLNGPIDPPNLTPVGYVSTKLTAPSNALDTVLSANFANYNATERPLKPITNWIRLHYVHSVSAATPPTLTVRLRYNSSVVGSDLPLQFREETAEGFIYNYSFNPSTLPGLTGRVGIYVTGTSTGASTPLPIGVEWITELDWHGTSDGWGWDSSNEGSGITGEIAYAQIVDLPRIIDPSEPEFGAVPYKIFEDETIYVYIEVSDWVEFALGSVKPPYVPLGGFEGSAFYAGRLAITEGLSIDLKETGGYIRRKTSDVNLLRTYGGTLRGTRNALHWNEYDFNARIQFQDTVLGELDDFFENAGMRNPVVLIPDERTPSQAIYGVLTRWQTPDVGGWVGDDGTGNYFDLSFSAIDARASRILR